MISVYQLKTNFQNVLRPIVEKMAKIGITANQVTIAAFLLSCIAGALVGIFYKQTTLVFLILPVILFIRMALNAVDGMLAREHNQKSALGAILNELGDILSDVVIYVPFLYALSVDMWLIMLVALLAVISETCGIMGIQIGASRRYDGPMGKSDRAFWFSLLAIVQAFFYIPMPVLEIIISIVILLLVHTTYNRCAGALREIK